MINGNYPTGAANDPDAPWNDVHENAYETIVVKTTDAILPDVLDMVREKIRDNIEDYLLFPSDRWETAFDRDDLYDDIIDNVVDELPSLVKEMWEDTNSRWHKKSLEGVGPGPELTDEIEKQMEKQSLMNRCIPAVDDEDAIQDAKKNGLYGS